MKFLYFDVLDSTHTYAKTNTFQEHTLIKAMIQTNGYGRRGDKWISLKGNFHGSLIFKNASIIPEKSGQLAFVFAVSVGQYLESLKCNNFSYKWPNDILLDGKKLAGILVEINDNDLIVSLGINLIPNPPYAHLELPEWNDHDLARSLENALINYITNGFKFYSDKWLERCAHMNQFVILYTGKSGIFQSIDTLGNPILNTKIS